MAEIRMRRNILKYIVLVILAQYFHSILGQTDNEFWFVAPNITSGHPNTKNKHHPGSVPIYLTLTSMDLPATVTIEQPANKYHASTNPEGFKDIVVTLPANTAKTLTLVKHAMDHEDSIMLKNLENIPYATVNNKGIRITATNLITAYYEVAQYYNTDIYALKGKNALGTEFYTSFQDYKNLGKYTPTPYSAIDIVASQDNTVIDVYPTNPVIGHGSGPFTITLNAGETYSIVPQNKREVDVNLRGTKITTRDGKKIAVTLTEDSKSENGGCKDMLGDQTIPMEAENNEGVMTPLVGKEYIVMKGDLGETTKKAFDQIYILATRDTAYVEITDVMNGEILYKKIPPRQTERYIINKALDGEIITHIISNQPIYVWHITGGGHGCEQGGAVLPAIDRCTGSSKVGFARSTKHKSFMANIMVRKGAEDGFTVNGDPTLVKASDFISIPGTNWSAASIEFSGSIPVGSSNLIVNTKDVFHFGIMNGDASTGGCYGYFSDFNEVEAEGIVAGTGQSGIKTCYNEEIQLLATGGTSFEWKPQKFLNDPFIAAPICKPTETSKYTVYAYGACAQVDSAIVNVIVGKPVNAEFTIDTNKACAPITINIHDKSTGAGGKTPYIWYKDNNYYSLKSSPPPVYFNNATDSAQEHVITLFVTDSLNLCADSTSQKITIYPSISADFNYTDSAGCNPLGVYFTNLSTGNVADSLYLWDFGDGAISADTSIFHSFTNFGKSDSIFNVKLIATSPYMCRDTANADILVHPFIDAAFTMDSSIACSPFHAYIKNTSMGVDSFYFDFGDGTDTIIKSFSSFIHTYNHTDSIPLNSYIRLVAKNNEGCYDTVQQNFTLYPTVNSSFSADKTSGCSIVSTSFTNLSSGFNLSYQWDFGDGNHSSEKDPAHVFNNSTIELIVDTVTLVVQSHYPGKICTSRASDTINIYPYIKAKFDIDTVKGCPPFTATINNTSLGVDNYHWDFGDGNQSQTISDTIFNHIYNNSSYSNNAIYLLSLQASNQYGCTDSYSKSIMVYPKIKADFQPNKITSCYPARFDFTNASKGAYTYHWDFGDSASSIASSPPEHEYPKNHSVLPKTYRVILDVEASNNRCKDSKDTVITVNPFLKAEFSVKDYIGCSPRVDSLINASIGEQNTYHWRIDNLLISSLKNKDPLVHSFSNTGNTTKKFLVELLAENDYGCTSKYLDTLAVYPEVLANFSTNTGLEGCHPLDLSFVNSSKNATRYFWDFGDKSTSTNENPLHVFKNLSHVSDSSYTVKLKVSSIHCSDSVSKVVKVHAKPRASFSLDKKAGCSPLEILITNQSQVTSATYNWFLEDVYPIQKSYKDPFHHTFYNVDSLISDQEITLTVITDNGCMDTTTSKIQVYPKVTSDFTMDKTVGCNPIDVQFSNSSIHADQLSWSFDDGETSNFPDPSHRFINYSGLDKTYRIVLSSSSKLGCKDTSIKIVTVYPSPGAQFEVSPVEQTYSENTAITITNLTNEQDTWDYQWDFGDGSSSNENKPSFSKEYSLWGTHENDYSFFITMKASHPKHPQCNDTYQHEIKIFPPLPQVDIQEIDSTGCVPLTVHFSIKHKAYEDSVIWDFGDGTLIKNEISPQHTFEKPGQYNVILTVFGSGGKDYDLKVIKAYTNPEVNFSVDTTQVVIPNATIQLYNTSNYGHEYLWTLGDGTTTAEFEPSHTYDELGLKDISLTVWTEHGCVDSLKKPQYILVKGEKKMAFPNAFKPNPDGSQGGEYDKFYKGSEIFRPYWKGVTKYNLKIYTRWGELIFETDDINVGWDGYYNGKICKQDAYVWKVEAHFTNGETLKEAGVVTLIR